jgi:hypothetical protein
LTKLEIYGILFLNKIFSNQRGDGWNFCFNFRSIKSNEEQKVTDWVKIAGNGTVRICPLQNGGGRLSLLDLKATYPGLRWNPFTEEGYMTHRIRNFKDKYI